MNDVWLHEAFTLKNKLLSKLGAMAIYLQIVVNHLFHFHFGLMNWLFVINEMRMAHERLESNLVFKKPIHLHVFEVILWCPYRSRFDCFHAMSFVMRCFVSLFVSIRLIKYHFVSFFCCEIQEIRCVAISVRFFFLQEISFSSLFLSFSSSALISNAILLGNFYFVFFIRVW